ncbi:MAG: GbsR/MarR family transcriptional regulator [Halioglobus sp.]
MPSPLSPAELDFIEQLGHQAESAGLTRITGRIWGLLVVSEEAVAPAEIATLLQVSRASISVGLRTLDSLELLHARTRPGDRQSYFEMREHPYTAMMQLQGRRAAANLALVRSALGKITKPAARKGLQDLESFYAIMLEGHAGMIAKLEGRSA